MGTITRNFANNILGTGEVDATDGVNGTIPATNVADASLNNITSLPSSVGYAIKSVASDPPSLNEGEIFYNSTAGTFKALVNIEAYSSAPSITTARRAGASAGTQTASWIAGGEVPGSPTFVSVTEEYNGSGWSSGGSLNTGRRNFSGAGTLTAGVAAGGFIPSSSPILSSATEEYDGSSWTSGNSLNTARGGFGGAGIQTAAFVGGGYTTADTNVTEEYDGTSWTSGGNLSLSARGREGAASGTLTAGLMVGGYSDAGATPNNDVEEYNGTSWTSGTNYPIAIAQVGNVGTQTDSLVMGGQTTGSPDVTGLTNKYDGTTWTTSPATFATSSREHFSAGNSSAAIKAGGFSSTTISTAEEFNSSTNTITAAAWASANAPTAPVYGGATGGTPTAAFLAAGFGTGNEPATQKTKNQHYNGTSWSEENDLNTARFYVGGAGTQTASLVFGGRIVPSPSYNNNSEEYDGSSWTAGNTIGTARQFGGSNGTQTAALAIGGNSPTNAVEEYDGTNWTSGTAYPTSNTSAAVRSVGPQTAAFAVGGSPATTNTNFYDGSTWTAGPSLVASTGEGNMSGSQTVAIKAGGNLGGTNYTNQSVRYDGTSWATSANLGTGRAAMPSGPTGDFSSTTALCFGGPLGAPTYEANQLEEFTGETITQVAKTLSSS